MKSIPMLLFAAAAAALWIADAGVSRTGRGALVATAVSTDTWTRTCSYLAPEGLVSKDVDAAEECPAIAPNASVMQAGLAR